MSFVQRFMSTNALEGLIPITLPDDFCKRLVMWESEFDDEQQHKTGNCNVY